MMENRGRMMAPGAVKAALKRDIAGGIKGGSDHIRDEQRLTGESAAQVTCKSRRPGHLSRCNGPRRCIQLVPLRFVKLASNSHGSVGSHKYLHDVGAVPIGMFN